MTVEPRTFIDRLGDSETEIIDAVRAEDGIRGLKAFSAYRDIVWQEARAAALREVAEKVAALQPSDRVPVQYRLGWGDARAAVRAILTEATGAPE